MSLRLLSKLLRFRTLWAYGFDSAARRAPEKSKVGEKEKYFISFNQLYFLKSRLRSAIKTGESHPKGLGLDGLTEQSAKL